MRILVLCHEFPPLGGGGSRVCDGLARALVAWAMRKLLNVRYIITEHGSDAPGYNRSRFPVLHRRLKPVWRRVLRDAEISRR